MKCQTLFSEKNKKNILKCHLCDFFTESDKRKYLT